MKRKDRDLPKMLTAREDFDLILADGSVEHFTRGVSRIRSDHELIRGIEDHFELLEDQRRDRAPVTRVTYEHIHVSDGRLN